ncbi:hypothetical protein L1987_85372 [Smallanthus sonchifolius]|uniref:Uncharacterized protein n=1 Tax=Smallanthus sonchifolius TaxID=185202 RepID=A0ACB8XWT1_9ASTR|nr:hypothetical protein L1987_85372 [Smallanthus sonchifolius]
MKTPMAAHLIPLYKSTPPIRSFPQFNFLIHHPHSNKSAPFVADRPTTGVFEFRVLLQERIFSFGVKPWNDKLQTSRLYTE